MSLRTISFLSVLLGSSFAIPTSQDNSPVYPRDALLSGRAPKYNDASAIKKWTPRADGPPPFQIVSVGDSYNSAVTYSGIYGDPSYDMNKDHCMRSSIAYANQLALNEDKWTSTPLALQFLGCSGAQLYNMAGDENQQLYKAKQPTGIVIMTAGGNNAGFFKIARDCVYTFDADDPNKDFGPEYKDDKDRKYPCAKAIDWTKDYISNQDKLYKDVQATLTDMVDKVLARPDFNENHNWRIFASGYAHFFNTNSPESDYCNDISFSSGPKGQWHLSNELRTDMNNLVTDFNNMYSKAITEYKFDNGQHELPDGFQNAGTIVYVSITEGFDHHRFCEPEFKDITPKPLYCDDNLWFWNLNFPPPAWDPCRDLHYDWKTPTHYNSTLPAGMPGLFAPDILGLSGSLPGGPPEASQGWALRPFHPKVGGHKSIKDSFVEAIKQGNVQGLAYG